MPFALLLLLIAVMPMTGRVWKKRWATFYAYVSIGLAVLVTCAYSFLQPGGFSSALHGYHDYISFTVLIGALYVTTGGIHLDLGGEATPEKNILFLIAGAILANVIGTTGASMLLIRPWLRWNRACVKGYHLVFFIFVISNIGGALTPIGDPPLFLGYLSGVPFFWLIEHLSFVWATTMVLILAVFYFFDTRRVRLAPQLGRELVSSLDDRWEIEGGLNITLLLLVVAAFFLPPTPWLREGVMLLSILLSVTWTNRAVWEKNKFSFDPLKEIVLLFFGIFGTMTPVLDFMREHASSLGLTYPLQYYFSTGLVSSVLDNAPTYSSFFELAKGTSRAQLPNVYAALSGSMGDSHLLVHYRPDYIAAISLGAVFFGASTYIGNGPNLLVKTIASEMGVPCPSFFGYIVCYSLPILFPILALVGFCFFS